METLTRNGLSTITQPFVVKQSQPAITCSKFTVETLEQGVKHVQS